MTGDWRDYRPAIWLGMLGLALTLAVNPPYIGAALIGAAIGVGFRIWQRRRRGPLKRS
jgi:4-amino-4-deoxy-L-arabinose transferase-like glycosyltransferase